MFAHRVPPIPETPGPERPEASTTPDAWQTSSLPDAGMQSSEGTVQGVGSRSRRGSAPEAVPVREAQRRPRIAIMGEFSAGKSTLTNLLMGDDALPVRVTATQLPPVWMSYGTGLAAGVSLDGAEFPVDLAAPEDIPLSTTRYLRIERPAEVLKLCDLLDFPGISDPNMPPEVWDRAAPLADSVLWCTHATQAWRQSEAAFWEEMPDHLRDTSLLLLTRIDKVREPRDRARVLARLRKETSGLFAGLFPVSLTRAIAAGDDSTAFEESGAADLMEALLDLVTRLTERVRDSGTEADLRPDAARIDAAFGMPGGTDTRTDGGARTGSGARATDGSGAPAIVPRRVHLRGGTTRRGRPPADTVIAPPRS